MQLTDKHRWIELIKWTTIGGSFLLFIVSLFLPALLFQDVDPVNGATLLGWGWWGLLLGNPAWCANPVFLIAILILLFKKHGFALIGGSIAFALGLLSFFASEYYFNEANSTPITGLGPAFYVWMLGFAVLIGGSLLSFVISKSK